MITAATTKPELVTVACHCPWCGVDLRNGEVIAVMRHGRLATLSQTVQLGENHYTWMHREGGCHLPQLERVLPNRFRERMKQV